VLPKLLQYRDETPFAVTDPTIGDCDLLSEYVEVRIRLLRDLLARDFAAGQTPGSSGMCPP
jgi:hypothetical protein